MDELVAYGTTIAMVGFVLTSSRTDIGHRIGPAPAAILAVAVLLATRIITSADLMEGFAALWRPLLTLLSIMLSTSVAERLGILTYLSRRLEPRTDQPVGHVFRSVFILSITVATVLNNDAAILLLTPLVVDMVRRCYPDRPDLVVAFAFAVFSAAGVAPLVISNPMNLIIAEYAGIGFNEYALRMAPIAIAGWIAAYMISRAIFRRELVQTVQNRSAQKSVDGLSPPARRFLGVMVLALGCYPILTYAGGPLWMVALGSAAIGLLLCSQHRVAAPRQLAASVSWGILVFLFCIFILVLGLRNVGLVARIADLYASASSAAAQLALIGVSSAVGSAVLNNHPMAMLNALAIHSLPQGTHQHVLAALIGGDLGPRLLPMGSLAGLLWLHALRKQGVRVSLSRFIGVGLRLTIPTLALSLLLLLFSRD